MVRALLSAVGRFSPEAYLTACKRAVDTGDGQRVQSLIEQAESCLSEPLPALPGVAILHAYTNGHRNMAKDLIAQCTSKQIAAAPPNLLRLVAERLRITPNHLTKLFRHEMGMSALDYVQNLRLRHAAELLRENSLNIQEIALESGFEDPNYFTRLFRQRHGMTPTRFRRISQTAEI